ncbi:hypothetical protein COCNU_10G003730 [Cocos nucifera]|uniref:Uncharacterized protein n=1 Tax=Cocos nucifera TaxID=13894 RepID=A0A8K0N8Q8_COCNU|nr:hypothetical protein COCNU_10G003730 [Cocos nucifera]
MPLRKALTRRLTVSAVRSRSDLSTLTSPPATQTSPTAMVDAEQFNLLVQQACNLMEAVQAIHRQAPMLIWPEQASAKSRDVVWGRPTWASRPMTSERKKQRVENPCSDHDSTQGEPCIRSTRKF